MIDDWRKTIPTVTRGQMVEVDRSMIEDFGIELLQMMENAGRHLAQLTRDRFPRRQRSLRARRHRRQWRRCSCCRETASRLGR